MKNVILFTVDKGGVGMNSASWEESGLRWIPQQL